MPCTHQPLPNRPRKARFCNPQRAHRPPHSAQSRGPHPWPRGLALCPVSPSWQEVAVRPLYPTAVLSRATGVGEGWIHHQK